jgi:hypothetical protein
MGKIKRSLIRSFLRTGSVGTPAWALIGEGVLAGKIQYSPKVTEETYIHEDSASKVVDSYAPSLPIEATAVHGDAVFDYVENLRINRKVLGNAETDIVNVWLYEGATLGYYEAEKQAVSIQVDDFGGDGGSAAKINFTINFIGEPVRGQFNPTPTAAFVPNPILAGLSSITFSTPTLTKAPVFNTNKLFYTAPTTVDAATLTVVPVTGGATIEITVNDDTVANGAAGGCEWEEGVNEVLISVTVGTETVIYTVEVTYTAA